MSDELEKLKREISGGSRVISVSGLTSTSAKAWVLTRLQQETGKRFVVVTDTNADVDAWVADLSFFADDSSIVTLPSFTTDPYSGASPHAETQEQRALALWQLARGEDDIVVMSARALIQRTIDPDEVRTLGYELKLESDVPPEEIVQRLAATGYVREEPIFGPGQFSVRGGIMDVWSPDAAAPVRIEFFGDTIDSIRTFDADTQLSTGQLTSISLAPMREFAVTPQDMKDWAFFARERFADGRFSRALRDRTEIAEDGETFSGWEFVMPMVKPLGATTFDHIADRVFVIDEPSAIEATLAQLYDHLDRSYSGSHDIGEVGLEPKELFLLPDELRTQLEKFPSIELRGLGRTAAATDEVFGLTVDQDVTGPIIGKLAAARVSAPLFLFSTAAKAAEIDLQSRSTRKFYGDVAAFASELKDRPQARVIAQTHGIAERLDDMLRDYDIVAETGLISVGALSSGFELPSEGLTFYSEADVFGETSGEAAARTQQIARKSKLGAFISDFRDLKAGDYVVHVDHGIGRFDGLQTISSQGAEREFMLLVYADDAKLFVPSERMDLVSRYSSGEAATPTLDKLGGLGWQKTKAKAKRAMRDMADELLKLYAERKLVRGHAFPPDAPWQHEFEDAFPYELTTDQATAIADVKNDMETAVPMDRLIIGDVGYGKTEVAMRAAFKAVMDGKQAAILTPTTVLAYQHYETFKKRFAAFPVKIDLLSRFRSTKEQKTVVEATDKGEVDVLIGTHRILSNDVKLPNLGLVVVDEEQRFGVGHKEKLKQLKKKVDVLTLSATPIPRTLNMSLLGMRDLSVIETPPRDRLAINTQVVQFSESVIRSAIELELSRNGQIFFIHNRVESIESIAALIQKIVPNARIAIGHGQMNEKLM
ncbi:MAG TPA: DEAD/DEAH box helicase, partial [Pyrinomonadaceae bacterium]|nr:DEAD/DEAH box helicase [Pyrinomonadaceae bacterium]